MISKKKKHKKNCDSLFIKLSTSRVVLYITPSPLSMQSVVVEYLTLEEILGALKPVAPHKQR